MQTNFHYSDMKSRNCQRFCLMKAKASIFAHYFGMQSRQKSQKYTKGIFSNKKCNKYQGIGYIGPK